MAYTPTEWARGDVVTSAKLNKLEQGVADAGGSGGILKVTMNAQTHTADKTWKEIHDAMTTGVIVVVVVLDDGENEVNHKFAMSAYYDSGNYIIELDMQGRSTLVTDSENGYPVQPQDTTS